MADFQGAVPVQTVRDDEFKIKIVDFSSGETATAGLKVESDGSVNVNANLKDPDGDELDINADGSINVVIADGAEICDFETAAAVATNAALTHDYVVTNTKTFKGLYVLAGGRGASKVEIGTFDGTDFTVLLTTNQQPALNLPIPIPAVKLLGDATAAIRVKVTNTDKSASDLYSTIQGSEF